MRSAVTCLIVVAASAVVLAQDAVKVAPTHYKVVLENASVRVLKVTYGPGEKSAMHQHPDAIVVPLVASKVKFTLPDGKTQDSEMANEAAQYTPAAVHSPTNIGGNVDALRGRIQGRGAWQGDAAGGASGNGGEGCWRKGRAQWRSESLRRRRSPKLLARPTNTIRSSSRSGPRIRCH